MTNFKFKNKMKDNQPTKFTKKKNIKNLCKCVYSYLFEKQGKI